MTGWVLWVVLTGTVPSKAQAFTGFATLADCQASARASVKATDRWICFNAG